MIEWSLRRPVTLLMMCLAALVLGVLSFQKIPLELLPAFEIPKATITTTQKGATAAEIEAQLTDPIERSLATLPSLKEIKSSSEKERSEILLEFNQNAKLKELLPLIKDRLDMTTLPDTATRPMIKTGMSNQNPLLSFVVPLKNMTLQAQDELIQTLESKLSAPLERLDGVALVQLTGKPRKQIQIQLKKETLMGRGIGFQQISGPIQERMKWTSLGEVLDEGKTLSLKIGNPYENLEDLKKTLIRVADGKSLPLDELATIHEVTLESLRPVRFQGTPALQIEVYKNSSANSVDLGQRLRAFLSDYSKAHPDFEYETTVDQSLEIENAIANIQQTVISGGIMASVIIYILLQVFWSSMVVSLTIPLSLLITLIAMASFDVSFNLMSLAGLALGVGMLVDNSTVVLESIDLSRRKIRDPFEAALYGAKRVAGAVVTSTLSTLAVFAPLLFVSGPVGFYFRDVAKTVSFSMLASLFVSLIMIPLFSIQEPGPPTKPPRSLTPSQHLSPAVYPKIGDLFRWYLQAAAWSLQTLGSWFVWMMKQNWFQIYSQIQRLRKRFLKPVLDQVGQFFNRIEHGIEKQIEFLLKKPFQSLSIVLGITSLGFIGVTMRGTELFPDEAVDRLTYRLELPTSTPERIVNEVHTQIEHDLAKNSRIESVLIERNVRGQTRSKLIIKTAARDLKIVSHQVQMSLAQQAYLKFERVPQTLVDQGPPLVIEIFAAGKTDSELVKIAEGITQELAQLEFLTEVQNLARPLVPEFRIQLIPEKIAQLNVDSSRFSSLIKDALIPTAIGLFESAGKTWPLILNTNAEKTLVNADALMQVSIANEEQKPLYLSEIAKPTTLDSPSLVLRRDRNRFVAIQAFLRSGDLESAAHKVQSQISKMNLDPSVHFEIRGQNEARKENLRQLSVALLMSLFIIFLLLASQFESLKQPFVILFAVPFCSVGVAAFLWLYGLSVSATVMVGFILLVGSAVSTSIVMVDTANQLTLEGLDPRNAIVKATLTRVRPILVTTASNILGLAPMLFTGSEPGGSMQLPLAVTMIGGLISSTWLTIIAVPLIYVLVTNKSDPKNA